MINYIKGTFTEVFDNMVIIENNEIGYEIMMPMTGIAKMPEVGMEVKVYTYMNVREDDMSLFGFLTKDEQKIFKILINVSGIGPKGAIGILSALSTDELRLAVFSDDVKEITKAPGIGKKTAQKLIIELKDKLELKGMDIEGFEGVDAKRMSEDSLHETIDALVALGYSNSESIKAVQAVEHNKDYSTEELLKLALKKIM